MYLDTIGSVFLKRNSKGGFESDFDNSIEKLLNRGGIPTTANGDSSSPMLPSSEDNLRFSGPEFRR